MFAVSHVEYPGVYVEEITSRVRSITGVETSTTAFVGRAIDGPTEAVRICSFADYQSVFGRPDPERELGYALRSFFENGGARAWVVRVPERAPLSNGLGALQTVDDLGLLCLPGETDLGVLRQALDVAARRGLFLIADSMHLDVEAALKIARELGADDGAKNGALYWPPLRISDAAGERFLPPSGAVAGVYARVDIARGVWKAPAAEVANVLGTKGPAVDVSEEQASDLADVGVNSIRAFGSRGIRVWGARTLSKDPEWRYVNVRRMFTFLEHSIDRGMRWTLFEPNDEPLWGQVRTAVATFLEDLWRRGAFRGSKPRDAFFVRCDRTVMTQDDIEDGRLVIEIGVAPIKPADFMILRIGRNLAGVASGVVGESTGQPGCELRLPHRWVDPSTVLVLVGEEQGWTFWVMTDDLAKSSPDDAVFMIEVDDGGYALLRFGDGKQGAIPTKGANVQVAYRYGRGDRPRRDSEDV
jgi:phage tail sheath protein FI